MGMQRPPFSMDLDRVGSAGEKGFRSGFGMGCAAAGGCGRRVSMWGNFLSRKPSIAWFVGKAKGTCRFVGKAKGAALPESDGNECCKKIRASDWSRLGCVGVAGEGARCILRSMLPGSLSAAGGGFDEEESWLGRTACLYAAGQAAVPMNYKADSDRLVRAAMDGAG